MMTISQKMKDKNIFQLFEPFVILTFWILLFASPIILEDSEYELNWNHIINVWQRFIPYLILFLINRYLLLPYLFFRNKRGWFILSAVLLIGIMSTADFYVQQSREEAQDRRIEQRPAHRRPEFMPPPSAPFRNGNGLRPQLPHLPPRQLPPFVSFVLISLLVVGFDTGLVLSVKWVQSEQKRMNSEKENVKTQLAFLRNQVSPHFFMNTLNNIHSLIDINTEEAKESILTLSKLMRHLLYDSEMEKIQIRKEMEFIESYVDLMRMRYSDQVQIDLDLIGDMPDKSIPPLLFTSYVENAFKHGISYQTKSFVKIAVRFTEDNLLFVVRNSMTENKKVDDASGIGTENSKKRLDLLYGDRYELDVKESKTEFVVKLNIPL